MTLTPEQREALQAVLNECADQDGLTRRDAIFAAGMRYAYEDAARMLRRYALRLLRGGTVAMSGNPYVAVPQDGCDDCAMAIRQRAKDSA